MTADLPATASGSRTRLSASKARSAISRLAVICGSSASAPAKSCACPAVGSKRNGLPSASTSAWILVLRPPRLRPSDWSSAFFESAGAVLMRPHDGAVDHRVFVIAIGYQVRKDALPYAGFGPPAEPPVGILPVAQAAPADRAMGFPHGTGTALPRQSDDCHARWHRRRPACRVAGP